MGKDHFERFFQEKLSNHRMPIDTEELWAGIEPTLPPNKRPLAPWLLATTLLLLLSVAALWWQGNREGQLQTSDLESISNTGASVAASSQEVKVTSDATPELGDTYENNPRPSNEMLGNALADIVESPVQAETVWSKVHGAQKPTTMAGNFENSTQQDNPSDQISSDNLSEVSTQIVPNNVTTSAQELGISIRFSPKIATDEVVESPNKTEETFGLRTSHVVDYLSTQVHKTESASLLESRDILPGLNDCYDFTERWWAWGLDVYGGMHYTHKALSSNGDNGELDNYIEARKDTESALEAFEFGVALNLMHRKGFVASVGFNYSQINEEFNYLRTRRETMFDSVVVRINIDSTGQVDSIRDWRPVTIQYSEQVITYNSFRMIDIPVGLGYQFTSGKMVFEIQAGAMLNLAFIKEGEILSSGLDVMEIDDTTFKTSVGLSGWLGVKALYPVSRRWSVYAEPIARFNVVPVTVDGYELTQRYNRFGLRVGARMVF